MGKSHGGPVGQGVGLQVNLLVGPSAELTGFDEAFWLTNHASLAIELLVDSDGAGALDLVVDHHVDVELVVHSVDELLLEVGHLGDGVGGGEGAYLNGEPAGQIESLLVDGGINITSDNCSACTADWCLEEVAGLGPWLIENAHFADFGDFLVDQHLEGELVSHSSDDLSLDIGDLDDLVEISIGHGAS